MISIAAEMRKLKQADFVREMEQWIAEDKKRRVLTEAERGALGHRFECRPESRGWWLCRCGAALPDLSPTWFKEGCDCLVCTPCRDRGWR